MRHNCCCDFVALTRINSVPGNGATYRLVGNEDFIPSPRWPRFPCWAIPWNTPGVLADYAGFPNIAPVLKPASGHVMGFLPRSYALIFTPLTDDSVKRCLLHQCIDQTGPPMFGGGGYSDVDTLVDATTGAAVLAAAIPAGTWDRASAVWSSADEDRLYGFSIYGTSGEDHFDQWSTDHSGGDFTTILSLTSGVGGLPLTMNVCNGRVYAISDSAIYENGSSVASIAGKNSGAVAWIGSQRLILKRSGGLNIVGGGSLEFVVDPHSLIYAYELYVPVSMSWDPLAKAIAVVWLFVDTDPSSFGTYSPNWPWSYTTYITKPISAGNLIGQDGVNTYANFPSGWGVGAFSTFVSGTRTSDDWSTVITGPLPVPLVIDGAFVAPPPPLPLPICDPFETCVGRIVDGATLSSYFTFFMFADCTQSGTDGTLGDYVDTVHWTNVNGYFNFSTVLSATSPCSGSTGSLTILWFIATGTQGNYADPGILWKTRAYADHPERHEETYVTGIYVQTECLDGGRGVHITKLMFETQQWIWIEPSTPTSFFPGCVEFDASAASLATFGATPLDCEFGGVPFTQIIEQMDFDYCGTSEQFIATSGLVS